MIVFHKLCRIASSLGVHKAELVSAVGRTWSGSVVHRFRPETAKLLCFVRCLLDVAYSHLPLEPYETTQADLSWTSPITSCSLSATFGLQAHGRLPGFLRSGKVREF